MRLRDILRRIVEWLRRKRPRLEPDGEELLEGLLLADWLMEEGEL